MCALDLHSPLSPINYPLSPRERLVQDRVIRLLRDQLGYTYLGDWTDRPDNYNIEPTLLRAWLEKRGYDRTTIDRALHQLQQAAALGEGRSLYDANRAVYELLRYGVKVKEAGKPAQTVWLVDWEHPERHHFAVAEEVTIQGEARKRPDLALYVNGIALAVLELKRSTVSVSEGIRQNLGNQQRAFIRNFFATVQLVVARNDTEGLRYGVIENPEKQYLTWKEEDPGWRPGAAGAKHLPMDRCAGGATPLYCALLRLVNPARLLELIHDFLAFDAGRKKICRPNQYFAVRAAQAYVRRCEGGIIWHTQGSGKSLTMVQLARWIREHMLDARVLIITDRVELDEQIEGDFLGVGEEIYRTHSGADLLHVLNRADRWLICSLIHKFGRGEEAALDDYVADLRAHLPGDFRPKGALHVFVDECHRTQSGKLHRAMKALLREAVFIGFTGTPLLAFSRMAQGIGSSYSTRQLLLLKGLIRSLSEDASNFFSPLFAAYARTHSMSSAQELWFDEADMAVWVEGRRIELSGLKYDLLRYLHRRLGQVCTRNEIINAIYCNEAADPQADLSPNRLDSLVRHLRQAIEPVPSRPRYLLSVRGQGYRLVATPDRGASTSEPQPSAAALRDPASCRFVRISTEKTDGTLNQDLYAALLRVAGF